MANSRSNNGRRDGKTRARITQVASEAKLGTVFIAMFIGMLSSEPALAADAYSPGGTATNSTAAEPQTIRGGLQITPRITARETYTDNVTLSSGSQKQSDFISELAPGFKITDKTARTNLDIDYALSNLFYARDRDRNTLNHQLHSNGKFELVESLIFLDARAQISQQAVSVLGPIGADSSVTDNNRTFRSYSLSPYLRKYLSNQAVAEARYTFSQVSSNAQTSAVSDSTGNRIFLSLDSGRAYRDWGLGVNFTDDRIDYENFADTQFQNVTGTGRYRINNRLIAIGTLGYDRNDYFTTGDKPEGAFWTLGMEWRPTARTSLSANAGRRYFGNTYSLVFLHRTRRTTWDISYGQDIQTSRSQLIIPPRETDRTQVETELREKNTGLTDDAIRQRADEIVNANRAGLNLQTNVVFLEKKLRGLLTVNLAKSDILLSAFDTTRDSEVTQSFSIFNNSGDFSLSRIIKQSGVGAHWNYRLTERNQANIGVDFSRLKFVDIQRTDNTSTFNLGISRKLSQTANGSLNYRHLQRDSNFGTGEYDENAIFGVITATF